jgi:hypothetical protein
MEVQVSLLQSMFDALVWLLQVLRMEMNLDATLKLLPGLFKEREENLDKREKDLERLKKNLEEEYPNAGEPGDVLHLDVGGTQVTVLRRTLTQVEGSLLASMYSGRWDDSLAKTNEGRFFIDQPAELFIPLVDYLRALASETPFVRPPKPPTFPNDTTGEKQYGFYRMVEYYRMSLGVYPVGVYRLDSSGDPSIPDAIHPDYEVKARGEFSTYCLLPLKGRHTQYIKTFEVKVISKDFSASPVQVGWMSVGHGLQLCAKAPDGTQGVGYGDYSVAWDTVRSGVVNARQFTPVPNASVKSGSVIRCEGRGTSWHIDGTLVASTARSSSAAQLTAPSLSGQVVPCVSLKGKLEFTAIEFDF